MIIVSHKKKQRQCTHKFYRCQLGLFAMGGLQDAITNLELLLNTVSIASVTASYETTQHMVKQYHIIT